MLKKLKNNQITEGSNCKVKRTYKKCKALALCNPQSEFGMIESCKNCKKQL